MKDQSSNNFQERDMKLKELIQVPLIKTVIQLVDASAGERVKLSELLSTFVVTVEIEFNLKVFLKRMFQEVK